MIWGLLKCTIEAKLYFANLTTEMLELLTYLPVSPSALCREVKLRRENLAPDITLSKCSFQS